MKALVHTKPYTMEFKDVPKPKKNQNQVNHKLQLLLRMLVRLKKEKELLILKAG